MEYCEGGDLSLVLKKLKISKSFLSEELVWNYFFQIVKGKLNYHH